MAKDWIAGATANSHGQFKKKAEDAGMSTAAYAAKEAGAPGVLGKQARLAQTLMGLHHHKGLSDEAKRRKSPVGKMYPSAKGE